MLAAGGIEPLTDCVRSADEDNPAGYYELDRVKDLDKGKDKSWLREARGRAVKVISFLLRELPHENRYKIVFMHRDIEEIIASQHKMLLRRGEPTSEEDDARARLDFQEHLKFVASLFKLRSNFEVLEVGYRDTIEDPLRQAKRVNRFLHGRLAVEKMASVVDKSLYRNQGSGSPDPWCEQDLRP